MGWECLEVSTTPRSSVFKCPVSYPCLYLGERGERVGTLAPACIKIHEIMH